MKSDGDDEDRYDDNRDVEVGRVEDSAHRRETWDEDAEAMGKNLRLEECRLAMETMRSCRH